MSTQLYDAALVQKIKGWTEKTKVHIVGPEESRQLFEVEADKTNDEALKLPIISVVREGGFTINNPNMEPLSYSGKKIHVSEEKIEQLRGIPITIPYRIDVYTRYYKEADEFIRELVFNLINHSTVKVTIPYNKIDFTHNFKITLHDECDDNSSVQERLVPKQFTRLSLRIDLDNAYLFDVRIKSPITVDGVGLNIYKEENSEDVVIEDINLKVEPND